MHLHRSRRITVALRGCRYAQRFRATPTCDFLTTGNRFTAWLTEHGYTTANPGYSGISIKRLIFIV
jgi:hypothetical protein